MTLPWRVCRHITDSLVRSPRTGLPLRWRFSGERRYQFLQNPEQLSPNQNLTDQMALSLKDKPMAPRTGQWISLHSECSPGFPKAFPRHFCHQKACSDVSLLCISLEVTAEVFSIFIALLSLTTPFSLILLPRQLGIPLTFLHSIFSQMLSKLCHT